MLQAIPPAGWALLFLLALMLGAFLCGLFRLVAGKELRLGKVEITTPQQRKLYEDGAKTLLENQSANARNLLSKVWLDIFETGRRAFAITDRRELHLLEDIAKLIDGKLQHAVHLDLLRNHLQDKSEEELLRYSEAKAEGYRNMVRALLHQYNAQLPGYPLTEIMDNIPEDEFRRLFGEIYVSSCEIAGRGDRQDNARKG